jgi:hypothetical protein
MKNGLKLVILAAGLVGSIQAQALEGKWVANFGIEPGGDRLITVDTSNGTKSTRANQGLAMNIGGVFPNNPEKTLETMVTIGFKFGGTLASNGEALWTSVPLELVQFYRADSFRVGLGGMYQLNNQVKIDLPNGPSGTVKFDDAFGMIVQAGWAPMNANYSLDLRYSSIKYVLPGFSGKADGSTVGIFGSVRF